jgi:hypothetical protein
MAWQGPQRQLETDRDTAGGQGGGLSNHISGETPERVDHGGQGAQGTGLVEVGHKASPAGVRVGDRACERCPLLCGGCLEGRAIA